VRRKVPAEPDEAYKAALDAALRRLARSDALVAEIHVALARSGYDDQTIHRVLAFLSEKRLIDDAKTIARFIESRQGGRALGRDAIRAQLLARGAPEDLVEEALDGLEATAWRDQMMALLRSRCKPSDGPEKGARLLLSRGFEPDEIESVLNAFFGDSR
jgi:regulatory protein